MDLEKLARETAGKFCYKNYPTLDVKEHTSIILSALQLAVKEKEKQILKLKEKINDNRFEAAKVISELERRYKLKRINR